MAERKYVHGLSVRAEGLTAVVCVGRKEIWDGADLSLCRDALRQLVQDGSRSIAVDLTSVQFIPSGFFGQLMDLSDRDISVELVSPHERVRQMLWFREFFEEADVDRFILRPEKCLLNFKAGHAERAPGKQRTGSSTLTSGEFLHYPCLETVAG